MKFRSIFTILAVHLFILLSFPAFALVEEYSIAHSWDPAKQIFDDGKFSDIFKLESSNFTLIGVNLTLTYSGTKSDKNPENWWTIINDYKLDNQLSDNQFETDSYYFTAAQIQNIFPDFASTHSFILTFDQKNGANTDSFFLSKAIVNFKYNAVPVPGAALLLGSGLLGVVALRRRRAA